MHLTVYTPDAVQTFTIHVIDPITLPASTVAYWKLDETAGNTFSDLTGVNNGTGNVSPLLLPDKLAVLNYLTALPLKLMFRLILLLTLPLLITSLLSSGIKETVPSSNQVAVCRVIPPANSGGLVLMLGNGKADFLC